MASVREIARHAGVSKATVSRVLTGYQYVSRNTRNLVLKSARDLGHVFQRSIAIIIPNYPNFAGYLGIMLSALQEEIKRNGYAAYILFERDYYGLDETLTDGAIAVLGNVGLEQQWGCQHPTIPLVCINSAANQLDRILKVSSDNRQGVFLALEYLAKHGHQRIAMLRIPQVPEGTSSQDVQERESAFLEWHKLHANHEPLPILNYPDDGTEHSFTHWHELGCTAILCPSEGVQLPVLSKLGKMQVRVPQELSVLSWEHPSVSPFTVPPMTTISQDFPGLSALAMQKLLARIHIQPIPATELLPYQLVERQTVASPPPLPSQP